MTVLGAQERFFPSIRLLAAERKSMRLPSKELTMKYFGTVESFDSAAGNGQIKPETGGEPIRFETTAIMWDKNTAPTMGQRLSYDVGSDKGQPRALNLQTI
jgi:cold shock CspA family protein